MAEPTDYTAVRSHLTEVTASPQFRSAPRLARFLEFVVETSLEGKSSDIKESLIAVEVYGRKPDYNPQADSIVRVEASRLRTRLAEYYTARVAPCPVRFQIPKGGYVPEFHFEPQHGAIATEGTPPSHRWHAVAALCLALLTSAVLWSKARSDSDGIRSIGVLPFVSLSDDRRTAEFSAGLTEEITTALARATPNLRVASVAGGKNGGFDAVLEGVVRRAGERLVITARLVQPSTGYHLWADRQERGATGEREAAAFLLTRMQHALRTGPAHPEAEPDAAVLDLYRQAQELLRIPVHKDGPPEKLPASVTKATELFRQVTNSSPMFVKGWAGLAEAAEWEYELRGNQPKALLQEAKAAALRATRLDPGLAEGWNTLTSILFYREWDLTSAAEACLRAMELDPRNTSVRQRYIDLLRLTGHHEEAEFQTARGIELQPVSPGLLIRRSLLNLDRGRFGQALADADQAATLTNQPPHYQKILCVQGMAYQAVGRVNEAEQSFRRALAHTPHDTCNEPALGYLLARTGRIREAEDVLSSLRAQSAKHRMTWFSQALVQTALGRVEDALTSLEHGRQQRDDAMLGAAVDLRLRPLHAQPRFQAIASLPSVRR